MDRALNNPGWVEENIGYWDRRTGARHGMEADAIALWGGSTYSGRGMDEPTRQVQRREPHDASTRTKDSSLRTLKWSNLLAEEYVRKAPREVDTAYRRRIAREFGWD